MQVTVEAGEGLVRKVVVQVPTETVEIEVDNRLQSMKSSVKIDGFRPGKVPMKVVKQRFGERVLYEVAGELIQKSFQDAVTQEDLKPAGTPQIKDEVIKSGEPLQYTAEFEIYPEVELAPVADLKIETTVAKVADSDVDKMLETLRKQHSDWTGVDRDSQDGDKVIVNFVGKVDGEVFDGGSADNVDIILGAGSMIPGFEDNLLGKAKDAEFSFEVPFPDDYNAANLAGKTAEFAIKIVDVQEPALPELNDDFAAKFGVKEGGVEQFKKDIRDNMERELNARTQAITKKEVMDKLLQANPIEVPDAMVQEEAKALEESEKQSGTGGREAGDYQEDAKRRVQLGMLLGELVKVSEIQPDADMVNARIELMAKDYEDTAEFVNYYKSNPQLMRSVETLVIEDMVVDWVAEQATVNSVEKTFDEVMNPAA